MNVDNNEFHRLMYVYYHEQFTYYYELQFHIAGVNDDPYNRRDIREWSEPILDDIWNKLVEHDRQLNNTTRNTME